MSRKKVFPAHDSTVTLSDIPNTHYPFVDTASAVAVTRRSPAGINSSQLAELPVELWLEVILRTENPYELVMASRDIHDCVKTNAFKALFLIYRYGSKHAASGAPRWRFFTACRLGLSRMNRSLSMFSINENPPLVTVIASTHERNATQINRWESAETIVPETIHIQGENEISSSDVDDPIDILVLDATPTERLRSTQDARELSAHRVEYSWESVGTYRKRCKGIGFNKNHPRSDPRSLIPQNGLGCAVTCVICAGMLRDKGRRERRRLVCGKTIASFANFLCLFPGNFRRRASIDDVETATGRSSNLEKLSKCHVESQQMGIIACLIHQKARPEPGIGSNALVRYAASVGHLNLLTQVLDWGMSALESQAVCASTYVSIPEPWMLGGTLLAESVRRCNYDLIQLLCGRSWDPQRPEQSIAHPKRGGGNAFELAIRRRDNRAIAILLANGGGPSTVQTAEYLLQAHLKRALVRRLFLGLLTPPRFFLLQDWTLRVGGRSEMTIEALILSFPVSPPLVQQGGHTRVRDEAFVRVADELVLPAITELGSIRLFQAAVKRGCTLGGNDGSTMFFSIMMGHWRTVRYLLEEIGNPSIALQQQQGLDSVFRTGRLIGLFFLVFLHLAVAGWFIFNVWGYAVAIYCFKTAPRMSKGENIPLSDWCQEQAGVNVLDEDYWERGALVIFILGLTVWIAHKGMPLHGVVYGAILAAGAARIRRRALQVSNARR
ncbi:hypothetical protein DFJ73DRAFT_836494 [Zopfochytrium polystomum]|nr:hypothetical protein DFJ73DRAFT_836494 [Zopfochytrium polystomum]